MPESDHTQFLRYEDRGAGMCAVLLVDDEDEEVFNRESLIVRLENLRRNGHPHEVTAGALANMPT